MGTTATTQRALAGLITVLAAGCGGSESNGVSSSGGPPADVAGKYSISVTNTDNSCNYANWKIGESSQNIEFVMTQSGSEATGEVKGLANFYFALLGIGPMKGPVTGSSASITAVGTNSIKQGQCAYFVRATADVTLTGDTINGTMTYRNETNKHPDCGILETCTSQQKIAGSRPPK